MPTWSRAAIDRICGKCPQHLKPGDPILIYRVPGLSREHIRCAFCARCDGIAVPTDLPPLKVRDVSAPTIGRLGLLPLDFTKRQTGRDE